MLKSGVFVALALAVGLCFPPQAMSAPKVLKMSALDPAHSLDTQLLEKNFVDYVNEHGDGRYKIELYAGSSLGNTETVVQGLLLDTIHLAWDSTGNFNQFADGLAVLDLPYMFERGQLEKLWASPAGERLLRLGNKTGLSFIGMACSYPRNFISRKPLHSAEAMQGTKNRTTGSKWHMVAIESMGLKPVPVAAAEMLTSIQQGMVDSMDIGMGAMIGYRVPDVAKHVTVTEHCQIFQAIACSTEWWDSLPEEDRALFHAAAANWRKAVDHAVITGSLKLVEELQALGCEVYTLPDADRAKLKAQSHQQLMDVLPSNMKELLLEIQTAMK